MAVSIRLRREGTKNSPYYKVVVADKRSPRDGKFIEIIGTYDPKKPGRNSTLEIDRVDYWISKGAQPSDTVRSLIKKNKKAATGESSPGAEQESSHSVQEDSSHAEVESSKPTQEESSPPAESSA
jgi:small subunit ribosomal protein S16